MTALLMISLESWLTIAAIIIGPLAALIIQKRLEDRRARENRKIQIFRDLMASRASKLSPMYVQALNGIETEFYGEQNVIEAWRSLVDQLYTPFRENDNEQATQWNNRATELTIGLLYEMAESFGYHFDKVTLRRNAYYPGGWGEVEVEQHQLRKAAVAVFSGTKPLKVEIEGSQQ